MSGICTDALNAGGAPSPDAIRAAGADGVRVVAFDDPRFIDYAQQMQDADLTVAVVLARESFPNTDWAGFAAYYSERVWPRYWVLGNEMDGYLLPDSFSSWAQRPAEYAAFWHATATAIRERQPEAQLCVGGLVSGQPWWLSGVLPLLDPPPDYTDIHPYSKSAEEARALFAAYDEAWGGPLLCLEWARTAGEIPEFQRMLAEETAWDCWFCWSDQMVPPFGLIDEQGQPKEVYVAFQAAQEDPVAEPNEQILSTMKSFEEAGGEVGTIYTVVDLTGGFQVANTDAGLFVSQESVPGAQILLDARAANPFRSRPR